MRTLVTISAITILISCNAVADEPLYKAKVPRSITTPDRTHTKYVGELEYVDGFPTDKTVTKVYDYIDTSRAVELFLNATPVTSMYAMLNGHAEIRFKANNTVGITEKLMNARSLWLSIC